MLGMPIQTPEALDGLEHTCGDPSQHHLPATPALHIPLHGPGCTNLVPRLSLPTDFAEDSKILEGGFA